MRKIILVVGLLIIYIGAFCNEKSKNIAEKLAVNWYMNEDSIEGLSAADVREADTFVFYMPKVGDVIAFENIEYTVLSDLTLKVTKVEPSAIGADGVLNIPEVVGKDGYDVVRKTLVIFGKEMPVTVMGKEVMHKRMDVKEVRMPSVKIVENRAFYYCEALTRVEMQGVETVEMYAFYECSALTTVEMQGVETVGIYAFFYCEALTEANMPVVKTVGEYSFSNCSALTKANMPVVKMVRVEAFYNCSALTTMVMQGVETVENYAFTYCKVLTSVEMPMVKTVGSRAFFSCKTLTSVIMPNPCCFQSNSFEDCPWNPTVAPVCP